MGKRRIKDHTRLLSGDGKKIRTNDRNNLKRYRNRNTDSLQERLNEYYDDYRPANSSRTGIQPVKARKKNVIIYRPPKFKKPMGNRMSDELIPMDELKPIPPTVSFNTRAGSKKPVRSGHAYTTDGFFNDDEEERRLLEKALLERKMPIRMLDDPWSFTFASMDPTKRVTSENISELINRQNLLKRQEQNDEQNPYVRSEKNVNRAPERRAVGIIRKKKELKERKKTAKEEAPYKDTEEYTLLCKEIDEAQNADMVELLLAIYTVSHRYAEK